MKFAVDLRRRIRAPRSRVYRAFLDPELVTRWWSPPGCVGTIATIEERVGGVHRVEFLSEDGEPHQFDSVIRELVPDERIELIFKFSPDAEETLLTLTFSDAEDGTEIRLEHERITLDPPLDETSVDVGWNGALDKLEGVFT